MISFNIAEVSETGGRDGNDQGLRRCPGHAIGDVAGARIAVRTGRDDEVLSRRTLPIGHRRR